MENNLIKAGTDCSFLPNITDAEYRSAFGLSQSCVKQFLKSPAHYLAYTETKVKTTPAMNFGTAFHAHILQDEPDNFFTVKKKVDGRSKEGRAYNEQFAVENQGKAVIDEDEHSKIKAMTLSLVGHPIANKLVKELTHREVAMFGNIETPNGSVRLKGLIDGYNENEGYALDLKSCENSSPQLFKNSIINFCYDIQNVQYEWLLRSNNKPINNFYFIAIEKEPPYAVSVFCISKSSLLKSQDLWYYALNQFALCQKTGNYPAYSNEIIEINL